VQLTTIRVLATKFDETVAFYRDTMGLHVRADAGVYVAFDADGFELGIYRRDDMKKVVPSLSAVRETSDSLLINFQVEDLASTMERLTAKGVSFETEAHDQPAWMMRVIHLRDPEGNLIELYEILPQP